MGRNSQPKQSTIKMVEQRRRELSLLIDAMLKLTNMFQLQTSVNVTKCWEHHKEIFVILNEIMNIEARQKIFFKHRKLYIDNYLTWLKENGVQHEGVEIFEFEDYDLGLKATKDFSEGSLILTIPSKVMMTEIDAKNSALSEFIAIDPLLQNMPNITLALFLLLEKINPESFWKPYIDTLPSKYSTILYFTPEELAELKPSPVFESSLKLYRSIARQYAYFYSKIFSLKTTMPVLKKLQEIFSFNSYRWAVSTVMTRQNNIQLSDRDVTAFIPLWDMCNHEHGKITTDFNKELERGECFALRDFKANEQIFIFYGKRPNADLFLHNGFVYPENKHDSLSLALGVSSSDPLRETKLALLAKIGLAGVTHFQLYGGDNPTSAELLAFIRIFNMNKEELTKWSSEGSTGDLVSADEASSRAVGADIDIRAHTYLLTRCKLILASYKSTGEEEDSVHGRIIKLLKQCEVQILEGAIKKLMEAFGKPPTA